MLREATEVDKVNKFKAYICKKVILLPVRTNLIAQVSRIHGHEIHVVSYACLDGNLSSNYT